MSSNSADHALAVDALHLLAGKYLQLAAFVVLIYDHIVTFSQEVERVWTRKLNGASILFLINRYVTPLQFIIIIDAFHDPIWTPAPAACKRIVLFEGASTVALLAVCELILILRVYALYSRCSRILCFLMVLWVAQITVSCVGLRSGYRVQLPLQLVGCILTGRGTLFPAIWVTPLITDTCICILTLWRTRKYIRRSRNMPTLHIFIRDGILYFLLICMVNLMNTLVYFLAVSDLKAIGASLSQLLTSVMISRLVLNLRSAPELSSNTVICEPTATTPMKFMTRAIGDLGGELQTILDDDIQHRDTDEIGLEDYPSPYKV